MVVIKEIDNEVESFLENFRRRLFSNSYADNNTDDVSKNEKQKTYYARVPLRSLPSMTELNALVQNTVQNCSWWNLYGVDWLHAFCGCVAFAIGLVTLKGLSWSEFLFGTFLLGYYHNMFGTKMGHLAAHGALCHSKRMKAFWKTVFIEFVGSYSVYMADEIHIKSHHPYTNIIGLGDSSTWKIPSLDRYMYLFITPLFLPLITPFVALKQLLFEEKQFRHCFKFLIISGFGLVFHVAMLMHVSKFTLLKALLYLPVYRAVFAIPYIHINIFQHIGLTMFSKEHKPVKLYQMSHGVLNLTKNSLLCSVFGNSLIDCHIEHHLFPRLSDNMCLHIKPQVMVFLQSHNLPYTEKSYVDRLVHFWKNYNELMVGAPPVTNFIGLQ